MSAIAGYYGPAHPDEGRSWLEAMIRSLRHRGPGARSFHLDSVVGLAEAHRVETSLSPISYPIANERGDLAIIADLDIFNHRELREGLGRRGHRFMTRSQAEIVVRLYEQYGPDFVSHLEGQFALALWDARRHRLLLARDRAGVRPLYYTEPAGRLWFASEIKALLAVLPERRELSAEGLAQAFTYWAPLEPKTVFRNVQSLPAGHTWLIEENGKRSLTRYWDWSFPRADEARSASTSLPEAIGGLRHVLNEAVRAQLEADSKVGAYLSGGLDSSAIVGLMSKLTGARVRTFSVAFEEAELDESSHQSTVARHFDTEHSIVHCSNRDIADVFPRLVHHTEAPLLRTAPAPLMLLSAHVRDAGHDTVLTGEGADEVFAGYDLFKEAQVRRFWARQPHSQLRPRLLERLYPYLEHSPAMAPAYARAFFGQGLEQKERPIFAHLPRWTSSGRALAFFAPELRAEIHGWDPLLACEDTLPKEIEVWQPLARYQYVEAKTLLTNHLLCSQGDRVSMANGVRGRFPFLDRRLIEYASRLPADWKLRGLEEKYILRRAVADLLPAPILHRPKQPYRAPDSKSFFSAGRAIAYIDDLLSETRLRSAGIFDPGAVERLREKCRSGRATGFADNQAFVGIVSTMLLDELFIRRRMH